MPAEQHKPPPVPEPARSYGREDPQAEAGMGRLENNSATPQPTEDQLGHTGQEGSSRRQVNAEPPADQQAQPDHSMLEEEPDGWDQAPLDIHDPRQKRQPRTEGKGGVP